MVLILASLYYNRGYRHSDTTLLEGHDPSKYVVSVINADALRMKVAGSGTGSIEIAAFDLGLNRGMKVSLLWPALRGFW